MMKNLLLITSMLFTFTSFARSLQIACGNNAYDALESNTPKMAEVYLEAKVKGPHNPVEIKSFIYQGRELIDQIQKVTNDITRNSYEINVNLRGYHSFSFEKVKDCSDLDFSTGELTFSEYIGGFAGSKPHRYTCNCLK